MSPLRQAPSALTAQDAVRRSEYLTEVLDILFQDPDIQHLVFDNAAVLQDILSDPSVADVLLANPGALGKVPAGAAFVYGAADDGFTLNDAGEKLQLVDGAGKVMDTLDFASAYTTDASGSASGEPTRGLKFRSRKTSVISLRLSRSESPRW